MLDEWNAMPRFPREIALGMGDANFWDVKELCGLYRRVGALERAEECFARLIALQPGAPLVDRRLAEVRESLRLERGPR